MAAKKKKEEKPASRYKLGDKELDFSKALPLVTGDYMAMEELGFDWSRLVKGSVTDAYYLVYVAAKKANDDITEDDIKALRASELMQLAKTIRLTNQEGANRPFLTPLTD